MNFLRNFLASVLGSIVAYGIIIVLLLLIISGMAAMVTAEKELTRISSNTVLKIDLNQQILDKTSDLQEFQELFDTDQKTLGLNTLVSGIKRAASDDQIKGISIRSDYIMAGWSQTHTIREALRNFKESGKFVYAYGNFFTQKGYYLASVADQVFMNPLGSLDFRGLASEVLYYKDFQDQYGVKMEVVRHGKYKSAVEPFLDREMSSSNRYQIRSLLFSVWETLRDDISESRNIAINDLDKIASVAQVSLPEQALDEKLIDRIEYIGGYEDALKQAADIAVAKKLKTVSMHRYHTAEKDYDADVKDRIAVIYAQGPILYGEGSETVIAQGTFKEALESAVEDDWVKAIVIRVNSPGGNALTSEIIWQAIEEAKKEKPIIASMGNVAASGGYYIVAGADKIFADPLTITGSIGVFATFPNVKGLTDDLGINAEQVTTHENAMGYSLFEPMQAGFKRTARESIENTYTVFKERVAKGRELSEAAVETIAQGRVWSGKSAASIGLVDTLGSLEEAVAEAAVMAEIEAYNVVNYPKVEPSFDNIFGGVFPGLKAYAPLQLLFPQLEAVLEEDQDKQRLLGTQTRLPFDLTIY